MSAPYKVDIFDALYALSPAEREAEPLIPPVVTRSKVVVAFL